MSAGPTDKVDKERRRFLVTATAVMGGVGLAATAVPFTASLLPSSKTAAEGGPVKVDISQLAPGAEMTVAWRKKPVWIIRRTEAALAELKKHTDKLRDPDSHVDQQPAYARNPYRSIKPEYLVLIGICTHLGCIPTYTPNVGELNADWPGGFFCPCHGSTFDLAGRVFKGVPAPINLEVPAYTFLDDHTILIGVDSKESAE